MRLLKIYGLGGKGGSTKAEQVFVLLSDGKVHERAKIAAALDYQDINSSGFKKVISKLSGLELVQYPSKPSLQLTDIAFPFGRPL